MKSRAARRPRIAIVGANFAGLAAAQHLDARYDVTVIDRSPWFEWLPNIHELLSGAKRPSDLRLSRPRLVRRAGHRFVQATVERIDARGGTLHLDDGRELDFDACIVAVGGVGETYGVAGVDRHAMQFKGIDDCAAIGRRLKALARGSGERDVVIVGGGLEGIEALGEILRRYRTLRTLRITVVEAGPRLLAGTPAALDARVRRHCADLNVRFLTNSPVTRITARRVYLRSGKPLRSDLTIWTGGVTAPPLLHASGLARKPREWASVTPALRSTRYENVFVIGDAAALPRPRSKQAYYALQMGEFVAGNAQRALAGRRLRKFRPAPKPMLIAFGDLDTFLVSGKSVIASPRLANLKEGVFQLTMAQLDPPVRPAAFKGLAGRLASAVGRQGTEP
jgi:NADH dehydrogenase